MLCINVILTRLQKVRKACGGLRTLWPKNWRGHPNCTYRIENLHFPQNQSLLKIEYFRNSESPKCSFYIKIEKVINPVTAGNLHARSCLLWKLCFLTSRNVNRLVPTCLNSRCILNESELHWPIFYWVCIHPRKRLRKSYLDLGTIKFLMSNSQETSSSLISFWVISEAIF